MSAELSARWKSAGGASGSRNAGNIFWGTRSGSGCALIAWERWSGLIRAVFEIAAGCRDKFCRVFQRLLKAAGALPFRLLFRIIPEFIFSCRCIFRSGTMAPIEPVCNLRYNEAAFSSCCFREGFLLPGYMRRIDHKGT